MVSAPLLLIKTPLPDVFSMSMNVDCVSMGSSELPMPPFAFSIRFIPMMSTPGLLSTIAPEVVNENVSPVAVSTPLISKLPVLAGSPIWVLPMMFPSSVSLMPRVSGSPSASSELPAKSTVVPDRNARRMTVRFPASMSPAEAVACERFMLLAVSVIPPVALPTTFTLAPV